MEIVFTPAAMEELDYWRRSGNMAVQGKITRLLDSMKETPFGGIGRPEQLKHELSGKWSRRINREHRVVYSVDNNIINVYSLYGHYK